MSTQLKEMESWYRKLVLNTPVIPPETVWKNVEDRMDIEEVWGALYQTLHMQRRGKWLQRMAVLSLSAAVILLLVASVFFTNLFFPDTLTHESMANRAELMRIPGRDLPPEPPFRLVTPIPGISGPGADTHTPPSLLSSWDEPFIPQLPETAIEGGSTRDDMLPYLPGMYTMEWKTDRETTTLAGYVPPTPEPAPGNSKSTRFLDNTYIGIGSDIKNSFLLNQTTFHSFRSTDLSSTLPDIHNSLFIKAGKDFSPRFGLRLEGGYSENGHKYQQYVRGKYVLREIDLDYFKLVPMVNIRLNQRHRNLRPWLGNILVGPYLGYLQAAHERIDDYRVNISRQYRTFDLGISLGYDLDIPLSSKLWISPGFRTKLGVVNINRNIENLPPEMIRTNNASFSFSLGISYQINPR